MEQEELIRQEHEDSQENPPEAPAEQPEKAAAQESEIPAEQPEIAAARDEGISEEEGRLPGRETEAGAGQEAQEEIKEENKAEIKGEALAERLKSIESEQERIKNLLLRLDRRFDTEIQNAQNRDTQVRAFYNELQDYKTGLVEKYLKNVLYDMADMRESMKKQAKRLRERGEESISLEEFLEYGEDLRSVLEKYNVTVYHGQTGVPIDALRQKIARKMETAEESLGKTVEESLTDGYEYHGKILYPEKISVYVYAPGNDKEKQ